jgi:group I intron endonuclease
MAYLYTHTRLDTNEVFYVGIGSDKDYSRAYTTHKRNKFWKNIVNKTKYEVIIKEDNKTWDEIIQLEKYWISYYGRRDLNKGTLVNLTDGGEGTYGRLHSEETKAKIGKKSKLKVFSKEYREKLSKVTKGKNNHRYGKPVSEETRKKISEAQIGEKHHFYGTKRAQSTKDKISKSQPYSIEVCKYDTNDNLIECYSSIGSAAKLNNISQGNLANYLSKPLKTKQNKIRHLKGFIWKKKQT